MRIAVIVPCFKVQAQILSVLEEIVPEVEKIYVVDDGCPESTGRYVSEQCRDPRVEVLFSGTNEGVGGAMVRGYRKALTDGYEVIVKLDGDGQMNPRSIPMIVRPILRGSADYVKGNRFYTLESLKGMPRLRLIGNTILSFVTKLSSGYWNLMDPTNGFTAIHAAALSVVPLDKLDKGYFFESDMLFRLNIVRAVTKEVPMRAMYGEEESNLAIIRVIKEFPFKHLVRTAKRLIYNYLVRDFNVCSLELLCGAPLMVFGVLFGAYHWYLGIITNTATPTGTIMVATLPIVIGAQLVLAAIHYDISNIPVAPLQESFD